MKFTSIPEEAKVQRPWLTHTPIGPPPGEEEEIGTLDALTGSQDGHGVIRFCAEVEEGDIERLQAGEKVWIELWSPVMYPISISVGTT